MSPEFTELIMKFNQLLEEEEARTEEAAPDLEPEDDSGNTEYKLKMCDLTMYKVKKRTTQMAFRLTVSSTTTSSNNFRAGRQRRGVLRGRSTRQW